ncbi:MAG: hypothetical protein Q4G07_11895 [Oscillospiraceae bacterium]|nr:hypothetical protein [Oscillospiraceae bacterium]
MKTKKLHKIFYLFLAASLLLTGCQSDMKTTQITFPAHKFGRNEYNARIFDISPFVLHIDLPAKWEISVPTSGDEAAAGFSAVDIVEGEKHIGEISYNTFELSEDATDENFYRSVYNQLMLSSIATWDNEYTPVKEDDNSCSATCKIMVNPPNQEETLYYPGILAYNKDLLVYISISFEENALSDEMLTDIAKSISLTR